MARVFRGDEPVGRIERTAHGSRFCYDATFLERMADGEGGIALHLPYARPETETFGVNLHSYFAGLLPEGLRMRALLRHVKTSEDDLLGLLVAAGADTIGDVSVVAEGEQPEQPELQAPVEHPERVRFGELLEESLRFGVRPARSESSVPGVQAKVSGAMISFPVHRRRSRESYLLKLNPPEVPCLVENEAFFMGMAAELGLETAEVRLLRDAEGRSGLLVKRFDRQPHKGGAPPVKVHQEDACQFLDRYPADKYLLGMGEVATGIEAVCATPILEVFKLLRLYAFSYLIANGDLHAKNISLHAPPGKRRLVLTPAYDVLSSLPYGDRHMALKLDARDESICGRDLSVFGERHGVRRAAMVDMLESLCDGAPAYMERLEEIGLDDKPTAYLRRVMGQRREDLGKV